MRAVGVLARAIPVLLVVAGALVAFASGVELGERPGVPDATALVQLYYALGLFVLGGLDLGVPTGGPEWARTLLWVCYFAGPAITTTAVVEGVLRLARPRWVLRLWNRDHTVVVGSGKIAQVYATVVRQRADRIRVVSPELLRDPAERHHLALGRARAVVLASADDLLNLDLAWELRQAHPRVPVACHVAAMGLRRTAASLAERAGVRMFNSHETAAARLFESTLAPHFASTEGADVVALVGFGRFGQTVFDYLQDNATGEVDRAVLVDHGAARLLRGFVEQVPIDPRVSCDTVDGDIRDPEVWDRIAASVGTHARPVVVLCTDEEATNLQAAIGLRQRLPEALLYVRHFPDSSFVDELGRHHGLEGVAVERVLTGALAEHYSELISK